MRFDEQDMIRSIAEGPSKSGCIQFQRSSATAIVPRNDYPPDYFSVPETATGFICHDFRRAYAENAPEPPLHASSLDVQDVKLFGTIDSDGPCTM